MSWIPDFQTYQKMYARSLKDPEGLWGEIAENFFWHRRWSRVLRYDWKDTIDVRWFEGGQTNICANAIDRHLPAQRDRLAYVWIGNDGEEKRITYGDLAYEVGRAANALKQSGV